MKNIVWCLLVIIILMNSQQDVFCQSITGIELKLPGFKKNELLASKSFTLNNNMFLMELLKIDGEKYLFCVRNISYPADTVREKFIENTNKMIELSSKLKHLYYEHQQIILTIDSLKINIAAGDLLNMAIANLQFKFSADSIALRKIQLDSVQIKSQLDDYDSLDFAKIPYLILPLIDAPLFTQFIGTSLAFLLDSSVTLLTPINSFIAGLVSELILQSQIKAINNNSEKAGLLCVNKNVAIYPTILQRKGRVQTSAFNKRDAIERRLKFRRRFLKNNMSALTDTNLITKLLQNSHTATKLIYLQSSTNTNTRSVLFNFLKKSTLHEIYTSTLFDEKGKALISEYAFNPKLIKKRWRNIGIKYTVNRRAKRLVQFANLAKTVDSLVVDEVQFEIRESSIINIQVKGHLMQSPASSLVFDNLNIPHPIASSIHYKDIGRYIPLQTRSVYNPAPLSIPTAISYDLNLWDVIAYTPAFQPGSDNLSPADCVDTINLVKSDGNCKVLYRTKTSKLFEIKVFNDALGFESDAPNGLVQIEVIKRIITVPRSTKVNGFTFVEPKFVWSKIEDKSNLSLARVNDSVPLGEKFSAVDLVRYSKLQLDLRVNGATFALPAASMNVYLNAGGGIYQTKVVDSTYTYDITTDSTGTDSTLQINSVKSENINTMNYYVDLEFRFTPDNRYNLILGARFGRFMPLNEKLLTTGINSAGKQLFNYFSTSLEASAAINGGRYFFRGVYTSNLENAKNNFFQLQIGVAKTLFKTKTN